MAELVRLFTMSGADFLDEWFEDERVKGALATQAIIEAWGGPMSPGSAYVLMHYWIGVVRHVAAARVPPPDCMRLDPSRPLPLRSVLINRRAGETSTQTRNSREGPLWAASLST